MQLLRGSPWTGLVQPLSTSQFDGLVAKTTQFTGHSTESIIGLHGRADRQSGTMGDWLETESKMGQRGTGGHTIEWILTLKRVLFPVLAIAMAGKYNEQMSTIFDRWSDRCAGLS